jgi:hypothetical protein
MKGVLLECGEEVSGWRAVLKTSCGVTYIGCCVVYDVIATYFDFIDRNLNHPLSLHGVQQNAKTLAQPVCTRSSTI